MQSISISYNFYFQFFQMPVADKYTELDITLMLHNYFHQLFIENQSLFDRKWRVCVCVYIGFLNVPTPGRRPFMEYPHGSNRKSSIWAPGIMSQIPDF